MEIRFRTMTGADVPFGMRLKGYAGWNQVEADWHAFLALEPAGCFVAEADGRPAGTVTTTRFSGRVGWIGMLLVHPAVRRRGIGSALLDRAILCLRGCGIPVIKLDATPEGRLVYSERDFKEEFGLERMEGVAQTTSAPGLEAIEAQAVPMLLQLDHRAFGVRRDRVIMRILRENPGTAFMVRNGCGEPAGFLLVRPGSRAFQIGPWIARDREAAGRLFEGALANLAGKPVFLDVPRENPEAAELVRRHGFKVQRHFTRMFLGRNDRPGDPRLVYATSGPEKG